MVKAIPKEEQVIIFSDIMHGSVNQYLMPFVDDERVFLITRNELSVGVSILLSSTVFYEDAKVATGGTGGGRRESKDEIIFVNQANEKGTVREKRDDYFE